MPATTAATIRDFMVQVVEHGTGTVGSDRGRRGRGQDRHRADAVRRARRTRGSSSFAPAEAPQYAVSVIVERGGVLGDEATGGRVAAPIAAKVLKFLLGK